MKLLGLLLLFLLSGRPLLAGDFQTRIDVGDLTVKDADPAEAKPSVKAVPRKKTTLSAGKKASVRWSLAYTGSTNRSDVLVHFYVVKEEYLGQPVIREAKPASILLENAATVDFHTGEDTKADLHLAFIDPGLYMVRLEAFADGETLVSTTIDVEVIP